LLTIRRTFRIKRAFATVLRIPHVCDSRQLPALIDMHDMGREGTPLVERTFTGYVQQ